MRTYYVRTYLLVYLLPNGALLYVQITLLNWMFTDSVELRSAFLRHSKELQRRFLKAGIFNLFAAPFVLPFLVVYFAFKHAEEFQAKRSYLGPRAWSPSAVWMFRDLNELPHFLERRMNGAFDKADVYQRQFPSAVLATVAK